MTKKEGKAKKIMYIICGVSVAVILFAFVWSKGFAKDDSESLSWNEYVKSSVSEERAAKRDNNLVAASKETKDINDRKKVISISEKSVHTLSTRRAADPAWGLRIIPQWHRSFLIQSITKVF